MGKSYIVVVNDNHDAIILYRVHLAFKLTILNGDRFNYHTITHTPNLGTRTEKLVELQSIHKLLTDICKQYRQV
jgi:hypothetical protein